MTTAADDPRCGRCGYRVAGLPTSICPECGADVNIVGVVPGGRWLLGWRRRTVRIGVWTATLSVAAGLFCAAEDHLPLPRVTVRQRFVTFFPGNDGQGLFATVSVTQTVHELGPASDRGPRPLGELILCLSNSADLSGNAAPGPSDLHVDWPTKAYHYTAGGHTVRHDDGFGAAALLVWLADNSVRPSDGVRPPPTLPTATVATYQANHLIGAVGQLALPAASPTPAMFPTHAGPILTETHALPGFDRLVEIGAACAWLLGGWILWRRPAGRAA
jgi:hypothetical protein